MRYVEGPGPGSCTICWHPCEDGYIDAGPVDIVCLKCANAIREALEELEEQDEEEPQSIIEPQTAGAEAKRQPRKASLKPRKGRRKDA